MCIIIIGISYNNYFIIVIFFNIKIFIKISINGVDYGWNFFVF